MMSPGKQTIAIYILPNISRKAMRQWNFVSYWNIRLETIFLKNHTQNEVEKLFPDTFLKDQNWASLWINSSVLYSFLFIVCQVEGHLKILKLSCGPLAFTSKPVQQKRGLELVSLPHFLNKFWRKILLLLYSINWPNFIILLPLLREIWSKCVL